MTLLYKARSQSVHELNACGQDRARSGDANMYEHGSAKPTKNGIHVVDCESAQR